VGSTNAAAASHHGPSGRDGEDLAAAMPVGVW